MNFFNDFFADIQKIHIAHEYILDRVHKCEYPKGRGQYGLVYSISGKAEYRFSSGERLWVSPGDVLFLAPNKAYSIATEEAFKHYTVNFRLHEDSSRLHALKGSFCHLKGEGTEPLERCFRKLVGAWREKKAGYEMQATGHLYELLSLFYLRYAEGQAPSNYHRLLPAKEHIEQHFHQPMSLEQLAWISNMSVTHFRREWKKWFAEPPMQYRDNIRLYYAKEYLQSGYYTISEIAAKCGFEDVSYFVRFFKKKTGLTPGEAKKQLF